MEHPCCRPPGFAGERLSYCGCLRRMSDKKRKKKALPQLLSLVHTLLAGNDMVKAAKALRKGVEEEVSCFRVAA